MIYTHVLGRGSWRRPESLDAMLHRVAIRAGEPQIVSRPMPVESIHFERSSYREMLIEHVFAGELMRHYWLAANDLLEVAKPQVDDGGYDLILQANGVIRHVQLKSSHSASKLASANVALSLGKKPSGCVVVIRFNVQTLAIGPFHFFGGVPGTPLPDISAFRPARNPRPNMQGIKKERPAQRSVPLKQFIPVASLELLAEQLFGLPRVG